MAKRIIYLICSIIFLSLFSVALLFCDSKKTINAEDTSINQNYNSYIIGDTRYNFDPYKENEFVIHNLSLGTYELKAKYIKPADDIERQDVWCCTKGQDLMKITWYTNGDVTSSLSICEHNY